MTAHPGGGDSSDDDGDLEFETVCVGDGVLEAQEYSKVVKGIARSVYGSEGAKRMIAHCPVSVNGVNVMAQVDTGADLTCCVRSLCDELGVTVRGAAGHLADYKGRHDERLGVVSLLVTKQGRMPVKWECEVVDTLGGGERFLIGIDLMPQLGIHLVGVADGFPEGSGVGPVRGGQDLAEDGGGSEQTACAGRVSALTVEKEEAVVLEDLKVHDVPAELEEFAIKDWLDEDRVGKEDVARLEALVREAVEENKMIHATEYCSHPHAVVRVDTKGATPVYVSQYQVADRLKPLVDDKVREYWEKEVIEEGPAGNKYNMALIPALKKDANGRYDPKNIAIRVCLDLRPLNVQLDDEPLKIPKIAELLEKIKGFAIATGIDLADGYFQMRVHREDVHKLAFTWKGRRYVFVRAPFGLKTMVSLFQALMEEMFNDPDVREVVIIYLDDVIVVTFRKEGEEWASVVERHGRDVSRALRVLTRWRARVNWKKFRLGYVRLRVLGHIMSGATRSVDPVKIEVLDRMVVPTSAKMVMRFLGFCNYLRDYVPCYASLTAPLERLKGVKDVVGAWARDPVYQQAFDAVRRALRNAVTLEVFDESEGTETFLTTDAMQAGIAAYISQKRVGETRERIVAIFSKGLNASQRNYPATKREGLALVFGLIKGKNYLWGRQFVARTDHKSLVYLLTCNELNDMMREWMFVFLNYSFSISYLPGKENVIADFFSRWLPEFVREDIDNHLRQLQDEVAGRVGLGREVASVRAQVGSAAVVTGPGESSRGGEKWVKGRVAALRVVEEAEPGVGVNFHVWAREIMGKVDPGEAKREGLMRELHEEAHMGGAGLVKRLWDEGWCWDGMKVDCEALVASCLPCLRYNVGKRGYHPARGLHATGPWDHICIDIGTLPASDAGYCKLLVIVCVATRFIVLRSLRDETAVSIAFALLSVFCDLGFPRAMQSDNGPQLVGLVMKEMARLFNICKRTVAAYNPAGNGLAENVVKLSKKLIKQLASGRLKVWERYTGVAQFGLNCRIASAHNSAPFSLFFIRAALLDSKVQKEAEAEVQAEGEQAEEVKADGQVDGNVYAEAMVEAKIWDESDFVERATKALQAIYPEVAKGMATRRDRRNKALDQSRRLVEELKPGTIVLMRTMDEGPDEAPWSPPMVVVARKGNAYKLRWGGSGTLLDRLVPIHMVKKAPKGTRVDGVYEVAHLLDHRIVDNTTEYLVKWTGFDEQDATWEPADHLMVGAQDAISDYWSARGKTVQAEPQAQQPTHRSKRDLRKQKRLTRLASQLLPHQAKD